MNKDLENKTDKMVGDVYDTLKTYLEVLVYGGNCKKNRSSIFIQKQMFLNSINELEKFCNFK